jgi:hypothetical protein
LPDPARLSQLTESAQIKGFHVKLPKGLELVEENIDKNHGDRGVETGKKWEGTLAGEPECKLGIGLVIKEHDLYDDLRTVDRIAEIRVRQGKWHNLSKEFITLAGAPGIRMSYRESTRSNLVYILRLENGMFAMMGETKAPLGSEPYQLMNALFASLERRIEF